MTCSIARTLDTAGEWWTPLILRDVHLGITRFDDCGAISRSPATCSAPAAPRLHPDREGSELSAP
jgi:DNA-binding HxlR family transcriptional regulator